MALPPIVTRRDTIKVISPADVAIDLDALPDNGPADGENSWYQDYCGGREPGRELPLLDGVQPTRFEVRPLNDREREFARALSEIGSASDDHEIQILTSTAYLGWCLRIGLVGVEGWDGWTFRRESRYGLRCWPDEMLDAMDSITAGFLGLTIHWLSSIPLVLAERSG